MSVQKIDVHDAEVKSTIGALSQEAKESETVAQSLLHTDGTKVTVTAPFFGALQDTGVVLSQATAAISDKLVNAQVQIADTVRKLIEIDASIADDASALMAFIDSSATTTASGATLVTDTSSTTGIG